MNRLFLEPGLDWTGHDLIGLWDANSYIKPKYSRAPRERYPAFEYTG